MSQHPTDFEEVYLEVVEVLTHQPRAWLVGRIETLRAAIRKVDKQLTALHAVKAMGSMPEREFKTNRSRLAKLRQDYDAELRGRKAALELSKDGEAESAKAERLVAREAANEAREREIDAVAEDLGITSRVTIENVLRSSEYVADRMTDLRTELARLGRQLDAWNRERQRRGLEPLEPKKTARRERLTTPG